MNNNVPLALPKKERAVLEVVFRLEQASVNDVLAAYPEGQSYAATRMLLQRLHKKGLLQAERDGHRYLYSATSKKSAAGKSALRNLISTFFRGSAVHAVSSLLTHEELSTDELDELEEMIAKARQRAQSRAGASRD